MTDHDLMMINLISIPFFRLEISFRDTCSHDDIFSQCHRKISDMIHLLSIEVISMICPPIRLFDMKLNSFLYASLDFR